MTSIIVLSDDCRTENIVVDTRFRDFSLIHVVPVTGKANRAYQPYQHRGDSSDGECDEDTAEFQPNRHQHSLPHQQYHRHRRPNHTYQQPGALLNTDTSGTSGNCSDATLTDSELAFTRDATLQLHDGT